MDSNIYQMFPTALQSWQTAENTTWAEEEQVHKKPEPTAESSKVRASENMKDRSVCKFEKMLKK